MKMDKIARNISKILLENNIIFQKDMEICAYGIVLFFTSILEISAVLIISLFVKNFIETVVFLIGFLPVRIYAGGYHANTKLRCFLILLAVYALFSFILIIEMQVIYKYAMIIIPIINVLCVWLWSPLKNRNKTLNEKEEKHFRNISVVLSVVEGLTVVVLDLFHIYNKFSIALFLGLLTVLLSLMTGKIKEFLIEGRVQR